MKTDRLVTWLILALVGGLCSIAVLSVVWGESPTVSEYRAFKQFASCMYAFGVVGPEVTGESVVFEEVFETCRIHNGIMVERMSDDKFRLSFKE